jgi:WD40 repeat protein/class 3 adenylate cyclase
MPGTAEMPTGTVTFLFTDIEGSTRLWEQQPRAMQAAVAHHDILLREAIEQHGGYVFKTVGDAFCAAFPTAPQALDAAIAAQRAILSADWESAGPIKVRMAIHTGVAEVRDNDYFGLPLNRVARLLSTGYGGQVLLSLATQQLVRDHLPEGVALKDLGEGGLKDLVKSEHIYQIVAPDLPSDFPPLKSVDAQYLEPGASDGRTLPVRVHNPYKGLRAFQETDAPDFFGREALTERLLMRMNEDVPLTRFLAVVGPSGSGKSSLVRAGLVPALRRGGVRGVAGSNRWLVVEVLPGAHPLEEVDAVLCNIAANPPATLMELLKDDERGLIRAVKRVLPRDESVELVLVIDQFEEVFTLVEDEPTRVHFLESLYQAVTDERSRLRVVVTLRADFFDRPLLYPDPGELMRQRTAVVLPLSAEELERAIVRPASQMGVASEPELIAAIIKDVGEQPGALPLLQYALTELFERRDQQTNSMTVAGYRESGGVLGALARRADELYEGLSDEEREACRQLFLRLITLGEGVEDTRRRVRRAELASITQDKKALDGVIDLYGRYRLLTFDSDPITNGPTVEVAHEALIRSWSKLREWLDASRADLRTQRQLMGEATEWERSNKDPSYLATGARLAQFEALAEGADRPGGVALTAAERAYLAASIEERDRQEKAEQQRQERELELARQAAEQAQQAAQSAQQAVKAQRSAASRLRYLVAGLAIFLAVAIGLSGFAVYQGQTAQANATRADQSATDANTQRQVAQSNAATAVANQNEAQHSQATAVASENQAKANLQLSEAQRLAAEANRVNSQNGISDLVALLAIRSLASTYTPQGDAMLQAASRQYYPFRRFPGITAPALSDGKHLMGLQPSEGVVSVIDNETGEQVYSMPWGTNWNRTADDKYILTWDNDWIVHTWDTLTGKELYHSPRPPSLPGYIVGRGAGEGVIDASHVVWSSPDQKTAVVWDLAAGKEATRLTFPSAPTSGCTFSNCISLDGKYYLTGHGDGTVRIWDLHSGATAALVRVLTAQGRSDSIHSVTFSQDGKLVVAEYNSPTNSVVVWNAQTGVEVVDLPDAEAASTLNKQSISSDGKYLLTMGNDGVVRLWDLTTKAAVKSFRDHPVGAYWVQFMPGSGDRQFLNFGADANTQLWEVDPQPQYPEYTDSGGAYEQLPGYIIGSSLDGKSMVVIDTQSGKELHRITFPTSPSWFSWPGARYFATSVSGTSGSGTGTATVWDQVWDTKTVNQVASFAVPNENIFQPSHDDKYVVSGATDGVVALWDVQTSKMVRDFKGFTSTISISSADISADDKYVVAASNQAASQDKSIRIWDAQSGQLVQRIAGRDAVVQLVYFTLDGKSVVSVYVDGIGIVWDVQTGKELHRFSIANNVGIGSNISVSYITSADMRYLAILVGGERTASVIDVQSGQEVRRISSPDQGLGFVGFSIDDTRLLVNYQDGAIWQTDLDYHDTIKYVCAQLGGRDFTDQERVQYSIADNQPTCPKP